MDDVEIQIIVCKDMHGGKRGEGTFEGIDLPGKRERGRRLLKISRETWK